MQQHLSILFLSIYIVVVLLIGIRNSGSKSSADYFLASRRLPAWLLAITFIASWWGGGSAIDLVDHAYRDGLASFWIYGVPVLFATLMMFFLAKKIRRSETLSQPQLMERRYGPTAGLLLTVFILVFMVLGAAVQVIVVGHFFQSFFGISYAMGALLGTSIVLLYSLFGGFRGVVLTDFLQFVFFLLGGVALLFYAYQESGGWEMVAKVAAAKGKTDYMSFWSLAPDYAVYVLTFGTSWSIQANVWQRIAAARTERSAQGMMLRCFFAFIPLYLMVTLTGMFSSTFIDEVPAGGIVPYLIGLVEHPWVAALIFIGLASAIMSTMDSMLNTGALSLTVDIYQKHLRPTATPRESVWIGRLSTLAISLLALLIGLRMESVLAVSWIGADFLATGAFVPLVCSFFWRGGTSRAAVVSMTFGLLFSLYNLAVALGAPLPTAWETASMQQALIGMTTSALLFVSVSLWGKGTKEAALQ